MTSVRADGGSFRDPAGHVYEGDDDSVIRVVTTHGADAFDAVEATGLLPELVAKDLLVPYERAPADQVPATETPVHAVLTHPRLALVSYPYEWSFDALKDAALFHLDVQAQALQRGVMLSDATAYNVQFRGTRPVFIDHLSFRPYRDGEFWQGHGQFCEQFLNPLLLDAVLGVPHNAWYRGRIEGIPSVELAKLLPRTSWLKPGQLFNVLLPARLQARSLGDSSDSAQKKAQQRRLPREALLRMFKGLERTVSALRPAAGGASVWADYAHDNSYQGASRDAKQDLIARTVAAARPATVLDVGCNTGDYALIALAEGARLVIGLEADPITANRAYQRAVAGGHAFLPLLADAANPSPAQGWNHAERKTLEQRLRTDFLQALAVVHHLAIGRNIPLPMVVDWLVDRAPEGIIEFVPKSDPMVERMLRLRDDVFGDYHEEAFAAALGRRAKIVARHALPDSDRTLFHYQRTEFTTPN